MERLKRKTTLRLILKNYHTECMVPAQRQKCRSIKQNIKPRDKSTHLWTPYLWQRRQKYTEKTISLTCGTGNTGQQPVKEWN